ncbi:MAG: DEAD/DEAH box helicase [Actinobacteria bacterium]|nr:DEAD/DEAH box helicase [Actinomycetota bacterium]
MVATASAPVAPEPELAPRASLDGFLKRWGDDPRLVHVEHLPARPACHGTLSRPLASEVWYRLRVDELWSHQAEAIDLLRAGQSVVVATGTASGKSLCYQAPIAESIATGTRTATSLLLFPTKALAHDQLRAITNLEIPGLMAATYDGDTPNDERQWVRQNANVVLTNPEMLHHGILPHHDRWATFLLRLRFVVVDELHILRGVFGSHVAQVLRRLRRLCAHYGSKPTFFFSSATIGEPDRLAAELAGVEVAAVTDDGSPRGERLFALWNPSAFDESGAAEVDNGRNTSAPRDTARLTADLVRRGHRTIAFARSRKSAELVAAEVNRRLPLHLRGAVRPYRGGYLPSERREIEGELFDGRLRGVVATTALELGVDIGGLDACVLCGFPGTVASLWQQAGRAGRKQSASLAALVAGDDQLDQWLMAHPHELFSRAPEAAVINPANPFVLLPHLACAAHELPLSHADERFWPGLLDDAVRQLVHADDLLVRPQHRRVTGPAAIWSGRGSPAHRIGLRSASSEEVRIATADGTLIGTVDQARAFHQVHPGAIYLHQGRTWRVCELDLDDRAATVEPSDGSTFTQPRSSSDISILEMLRSRPAGRVELSLGTVRVVSHITGYRLIDSFTSEVIDTFDLDLPPTELVTRAFWYTIEDGVMGDAGITAEALAGTLHAAEHANIGLLPLFAICDRWDVGGVSTTCLADTGRPTIAIYDGHPGGAGIAELGYDAADDLLRATLDVIDSCRCASGCPSCVQSPKCGNGNDPLDKAGATALLRTIIGNDEAASSALDSDRRGRREAGALPRQTDKRHAHR